jgi:hypothetical protein
LWSKAYLLVRRSEHKSMITPRYIKLSVAEGGNN